MDKKKEDQRIKELKDRYIRFDWAIKRLLRQKANFGVLEGFLTVFSWREDFYGDSEYDMDELDKSGFDGLGEGPMDNPYDDERF